MRISDWSSDVCSSDLSITLEPGGQFELSGAPLETIHQTCIEVNTHLKQIREIGKEIGIAMMGMGFQPKWHRDEIPVMPKGRYGIMRSYMPKKGKLGLDMMFRRSEEHTSELQSLMRISYAVFCLNKKRKYSIQQHNN